MNCFSFLLNFPQSDVFYIFSSFIVFQLSLLLKNEDCVLFRAISSVVKSMNGKLELGNSIFESDSLRWGFQHQSHGVSINGQSKYSSCTKAVRPMSTSTSCRTTPGIVKDSHDTILNEIMLRSTALFCLFL